MQEFGIVTYRLPQPSSLECDHFLFMAPDSHPQQSFGRVFEMRKDHSNRKKLAGGGFRPHGRILFVKSVAEVFAAGWV